MIYILSQSTLFMIISHAAFLMIFNPLIVENSSQLEFKRNVH